MEIWERSETYLQDFYARAGNESHRRGWDFRYPISSSWTKCASTCGSTGTALTDHYSVVSLHMGRSFDRPALGCTAAIDFAA